MGIMSDNSFIAIITDGIKAGLLVLWAVVVSCYENVSACLPFLPGRQKIITSDVVLITGGGRGIGRLIALEIAKHNPKQIVLWGQNKETLEMTKRSIEMKNVKCDCMVCDVASWEQVVKQGQKVKEKYGPVTILINNAGIVYGNTVLESEPTEMERTMQVNTMGQFWTVKYFMKDMMKNNHGHLVFINSLLGLMGLAGAADYSASKFGMLGFTESLQNEIRREGKDVLVTSIHPFMINTDMFAGCTTRFPWLFPTLDKEYVAWKTVDSLLCNYSMVIIPRLMYITYLMKTILPYDALWAIQNFAGVQKAMDTFHGRKKKD